MQITAAELRLNLGHYLDLVLTEDIWISRDGKTIAKLTNPNISAVDAISGILKGKVSEDMDRHALRDERMSQHAAHD